MTMATGSLNIVAWSAVNTGVNNTWAEVDTAA